MKAPINLVLERKRLKLDSYKNYIEIGMFKVVFRKFWYIRVWSVLYSGIVFVRVLIQSQVEWQSCWNLKVWVDGWLVVGWVSLLLYLGTVVPLEFEGDVEKVQLCRGESSKRLVTLVAFVIRFLIFEINT